MAFNLSLGFLGLSESKLLGGEPRELKRLTQYLRFLVREFLAHMFQFARDFQPIPIFGAMMAQPEGGRLEIAFFYRCNDLAFSDI